MFLRADIDFSPHRQIALPELFDVRQDAKVLIGETITNFNAVIFTLRAEAHRPFQPG
jgi:hypothetical protein